MSGMAGDLFVRNEWPHPTAAERLRLPVARMSEVLSAATTVAPSRLRSATS